MQSVKKTFKLWPLLILVAFAACKTQKEQTSKHKQRPQSPIVKAVEKYAGSNGADTLVQLEEFDKNGNKTRLVKYNADGKTPEFEVKYTSNEDGKVIKTETVYTDGTSETEDHTLDGSGKTMKTIWRRSDGMQGRHEYKYDDKDSIVQWDWYEGDKFIISRLYPYVYNDEGELEESFYKETKNNRDTSIINHWVYSYDSLGRLTRKLSLDREQLAMIQEFMYDSLDNRIIELVYSPDTMETGSLTLSHRQFNTFNEFGEVVTTNISKDKGDIELSISRKYDDFGHLTETVYNYANGTQRVERYKYKFYDDNRVRK